MQHNRIHFCPINIFSFWPCKNTKVQLLISKLFQLKYAISGIVQCFNGIIVEKIPYNVSLLRTTVVLCSYYLRNRILVEI